MGSAQNSYPPPSRTRAYRDSNAWRGESGGHCPPGIPHATGSPGSDHTNMKPKTGQAPTRTCGQPTGTDPRPTRAGKQGTVDRLPFGGTTTETGTDSYRLATTHARAEEWAKAS